MLRKKTTQTIPETERRVSGIEKLRPASIIPVSETRPLLLGREAKSRSSGAWNVRCLSELEEDISPLTPSIISALREEIKSGSSPMTRVYLTQAIAYHARNRYDTEPFIPVLSACVDDANLHVRLNAITAITDHAKSGGDISLLIDKLVPKLEDMSQLIQEISLAALKTHAASGPMAAHQVLLALGGGDERLNDSVQERRADLRTHCEEVLRNKV